jgi:hypothetical protein
VYGHPYQPFVHHGYGGAHGRHPHYLSGWVGFYSVHKDVNEETLFLLLHLYLLTPDTLNNCEGRFIIITGKANWVPRVERIVSLISGSMVTPEARDLAKRARHQRTCVHA